MRCVETATAVADLLDVGVKIEPGISEVGTASHKLLTTAELAGALPRVDTSYVPVLAHSDIGPERSDQQAASRARAAALTVRGRLAGAILFIGHGASCLGLVSAFGASGYTGYTSLTHFSRAAQTDKWVLQGEFGSVAHLSDQATARGSAW